MLVLVDFNPLNETDEQKDSKHTIAAVPKGFPRSMAQFGLSPFYNFAMHR